MDQLGSTFYMFKSLKLGGLRMFKVSFECLLRNLEKIAFWLNIFQMGGSTTN